MGKNKERKRKGLVAVAACFIALAVVFGVLAAVFGAFSTENWLKANKNIRLKQGLYAEPQEVITSLSTQNITALDIDEGGGEVIVTHYDGDEISVRYFEDKEGDAAVKVENGTLKIGGEFGSSGVFTLNSGKLYYSLGIDWWLYKDKYITEVKLPRSVSFLNSKISVSGGMVSVKGVNLGEVTKCEVSGGKIVLTDCVAKDFNEISVSGGAAEFNRVEMGGTGRIEVSGGKAEFSGCTVDSSSKFTKTEIKISGGSVKFDGGTQCPNLEIKVSGGLAEFKSFAYSASEIGFDIKKSGGSVKLNGKNVREGTSGGQGAKCFIEAKISGGSLKITTKK